MDEDLLDVARCVRPYLEELTGSEKAASAYDGEIAVLLGAANRGTDVEAELSVLLQRSPKVHAFVAKVLEDPLHRPPDLQPTHELSEYEQLPGAGSSVPVTKYCCPQRDYTWWRRSIGVPVPTCPTHQILLAPCP
jgi:hypothetical protein